MREAAIKAAFATALEGLDLPNLQLENTNLGVLNKLVPWTRGTVLPARPSHLTVGVGGIEYLSGFLQLDVFAPLGKGSIDADTLADTVVSAFPPRTRLEAEGDTIVVDRSYTQRAQSFDSFYQIPVIVEFFVMTHRN